MSNTPTKQASHSNSNSRKTNPKRKSNQTLTPNTPARQTRGTTHPTPATTTTTAAATQPQTLPNNNNLNQPQSPPRRRIPPETTPPAQQQQHPPLPRLLAPHNPRQRTLGKRIRLRFRKGVRRRGRVVVRLHWRWVRGLEGLGKLRVEMPGQGGRARAVVVRLRKLFWKRILILVLVLGQLIDLVRVTEWFGGV